MIIQFDVNGSQFFDQEELEDCIIALIGVAESKDYLSYEMREFVYDFRENGVSKDPLTYQETIEYL